MSPIIISLAIALSGQPIPLPGAAVQSVQYYQDYECGPRCQEHRAWERRREAERRRERHEEWEYEHRPPPRYGS